MCSKSKSSFNGRISEIAGIAVDNFEDSNLESQGFFLSHCHSDHTQGLFSKKLLDIVKKENVYIYTSELSKEIIADDCTNNPSLMNYIRPLPLGTTHVTLPSVFKYKETTIRVTTAPAGHCLGSVMFIFQTNNCTVLYTGDFNLSSNDLRKYEHFHNSSNQPLHIDAIYVDTTFISPLYQYFPKRSDVIREMLLILEDWLKDDHHYISLNTSAKYGYEFAYEQIKKRLGHSVYVSEERWRFYKEHQNLFKAITNKEDGCRFHICRDKNPNGYHQLCGLQNTKGKKFLFVRFSAMKWNCFETGEKAVNRLSDTRLDICFPTHCSRSQIIAFVNYFDPRKVVGFPNPYPEDKITKISTKVADVTPIKRKISPLKESRTLVKGKKVDRTILKHIFDI